ncbi:MAG: glycoside hydrolase family 10 protein [Bacteroidaceae bacterium]
MHLKTYLAGVCLAFALSLFAQSPSPKREFRGAWLHSVSGIYQNKGTQATQQLIRTQLDSLQRAGINAILFQVRPEADALYASSIEPWSRFLTGTQGEAPQPLWDPMAFTIEQCHQRGMEFHAWINPYRVKTSLRTELAPGHVYHRHPEWFITYGNQLFFNPGLPESRKHIGRVVEDIVSRYDIDGIHMDDYFYPYPIPGETFDDELSFARYGMGFGRKEDWRRDNVNVLIKQLHEQIHALKPWVKFGVSPFGIYRNRRNDPNGSETNGLQNYDDLYADILLWVNNGWVDYTIPQVYWEIGHPAADYATLVAWWARNAANRPLFIGQDVKRTVEKPDVQDSTIHQMRRKMELQRSYPTIQGSCQWPGVEVVANTGHYADALATRYHACPALQPAFPFLDDQAPKPVSKLKAVWTSDGYLLFWKAPQSKDPMDEVHGFVVYRFGAKEKANLDDPAKIVAITRKPFYKLPYRNGKTKYRYVVTALDRLQNESKPADKKIKL